MSSPVALPFWAHDSAKVVFAAHACPIAVSEEFRYTGVLSELATLSVALAKQEKGIVFSVPLGVGQHRYSTYKPDTAEVVIK